MKTICEVCGKNTQSEYLGITQNNKYYCVSCFELLTGKEVKIKCEN